MLEKKIKRKIRRLLGQPASSQREKSTYEAASNKALNKFYGKVRASRWHDNNFSREDDIDLTEEEIKAIDEYWGRYSFAYPEIFYDSFKTFKNRCGYFDVRHCPGAIRQHYFNPYFNNKDYMVAHQNKGLYPLMYPDVSKPATIARRMAGMFFDGDYNYRVYKDVIKIIADDLRDGHDLIIKPSGIGGGKRIQFLFANGNNTEAEVEAAINAVGPIALVVQRILEQSPFMKKFNESSLNTIRVTTMLYKGKVIPLGALIRIGAPGSKLDNYTQGGTVLGVDVKTGTCNKWAMTHDLERITELPSGLVLDKEDLNIPNYNKIVEAVVRMHYLTPYNRLISWDMALDKDDVPTMIENNFAGSLQLHEAVGGPLFGEYMDELLERFLGKDFNVEFKTKDWVFKEYNDHIVISTYLGKDKVVVIPEEIKGKPVSVDKNAFGNRSEEIIIGRSNK